MQGTTIRLLNGVDRNTLKQGICAYNRMFAFGIGGKFLGEEPISYTFTRMLEIDLISIINVNNQLEVAYNINKVFNKFDVYADVFDILKWCQTHPDLKVIGRRDGVVNDSQGSVNYTQYFFGFATGKITENQIQEVFKVNG